MRGLRVPDPFLDPRLFRSVPFSSAALVSLLTGYAFATAIIGGAVFVDRVLYGGPDDQRLALGALALATAVGALASGFVVRVVPLALVALVGIGLSIVGLVLMSRWTSAVSLDTVAISLAHLRVRLRTDRDPALDRGGRGGRAARVRDRVGGRDRGADARHGGRPGHPDGVRLDHDRPALRRGLRDPRRLPASSSPSPCAIARCVTRSSSAR